MKDVNKIILMGRLGADPIRRETKAGNPVVHFPLATSKKLKGTEEGDTLKEETQWHRVVVWGKQGEDCATFLKKGQGVFIEGSLKSRKYEAKDGTERYSFEVIADSVSFLPRRELEVASA